MSILSKIFSSVFTQMEISQTTQGKSKEKTDLSVEFAIYAETFELVKEYTIEMNMSFVFYSFN
jgi:hypothetical protein